MSIPFGVYSIYLMKIPKYTIIISSNILEKVYPIGSIYMSVNSTNPSELFGGEWKSWCNGRVPVGVYDQDTDFDEAEKYGGEKAHILTINEMPNHNHAFPYYTYAVNGGGTANGLPYNITSTQSVGMDYAGMNGTGSNWAHNNMPPYLTCYMWKRIA